MLFTRVKEPIDSTDSGDWGVVDEAARMLAPVYQDLYGGGVY